LQHRPFRTLWLAQCVSIFGDFLALFGVINPAQTMSQQETPSQMIGRVSSSFMSLISLAQVLGLLLSGYLAQRLGIRPLFMVSAGMLALIAGTGYLRIRGTSAPVRTATP
jgi:MFS transporter, DHA3 family, macrolide efflux protein